MRFDWSTLALQTVNVLVLLWLLRKFLFRPVMAIIATRKAAADKLLADAAAVREQAHAEVDEIRRRKDALAKEGARILVDARVTAESERTGILVQANSDAAQARNAALASIARERSEMQRMLQAEARRLAVTIASRLLGRVSTEVVDAALLQSLVARLAALTPDERRALMDPASDLEVVTAAPLDESSRATWSEMLTRGLRASPILRFATDPSLIAGVELRGPHAQLRNSWQADLDRIAQELGRDDERLAVV